MKINESECISCGQCVEECPHFAIDYKNSNGYKRAYIDSRACLNCGQCRNVCPNNAISEEI